MAQGSIKLLSLAGSWGRSYGELGLTRPGNEASYEPHPCTPSTSREGELSKITLSSNVLCSHECAPRVDSWAWAPTAAWRNWK